MATKMAWFAQVFRRYLFCLVVYNTSVWTFAILCLLFAKLYVRIHTLEMLL